ncbi:MAG: hypothetical protein M3177_09465, partial [Pseudomonadota bacterium]|nr:hypothetical protein [Pseudomonadota bacterium]
MISGDHFAATVRGSGTSVWTVLDQSTRRIELPVEILAIHVAGEDGARYDLDLRDRRTEDSVAVSALSVRPAGQFRGRPATLGAGRWPTDEEFGTADHIHLGSGERLAVSLHSPGARDIDERAPVLRVRRDLDGLDIGFAFFDYRLQVRSGAALLVPGPGARRGVLFNPQHLQEEVFNDPVPAGSNFLSRTWSFFSNLVSGSAVPPSTCSQIRVEFRNIGTPGAYGAEGGPTSLLARTRISGLSRIIFERPTAPPPPIPLSVEKLTDWSGLTLQTAARAAGDLSLDEQITGIAGITPRMSRRQAQGRVVASLAAPLASETALELVTGLIFSPDRTARFRTPRISPGEAGGPLWSTQLELLPVHEPGQASPPLARVRAIWSAGFRPQDHIGPQCGTPHPGDIEYMTSIDAQDRREIVMLSSAFGLAALRAVTLQGEDVPHSLVRRPKADFDYVSDDQLRIPRFDPTDKAPLVYQEGVMSPAPFAHFAARLTSFGADLNAEWRGEPAAPYQAPGTPPFFERALTVERYIHRTSLGSDVYVEVVYKGFLFPYGFRASLIKITEREPKVVGDLGPMMPAIQRYFILPSNKVKRFPGIYQPFDGREIPVRFARMTGGLSPELEFDFTPVVTLPPAQAASDGSACPANSASPCREPEGKLFWPKAKGVAAPSEILFSFEADDTGVRRSAPMIFVDNAAAHHPETMRALVEHYNGSSLEARLRTEYHHGGRTTYADPGLRRPDSAPDQSFDGNTSFDTDHILLGARGRILVDPATRQESEYFAMDAFMEGADEPPFYPVMREATIAIPPLDRLLGSPQGLKRVGYDGTYVRQGFDPRVNPGELYLRFLEGNGVMQIAGRGEVSGGVVQTPTPLAGVSRAN